MSGDRVNARHGIASAWHKLYYRLNAVGTEAPALRGYVGSDLDHRIAGSGQDGAALQGRLL